MRAFRPLAYLAPLALAVALVPLLKSDAPPPGAGGLAVVDGAARTTQGLRFRESPSGVDVASVQDTVATTRRTAIVRAAERVAPSVVSVNVIRRQTVQPRTFFDQFFVGPGAMREVQGLGSGFIIDDRGYAITNEHVVRGATEIVVTTADGRDFQAEIVGTDEVTDLALLRLTDPEPTALDVAPLGSSADLVIGEWVVAIGNPFGFLLSNAEPTVTAGVVSGIHRNIIPSGQGRSYYLDMIQTDASINPGNSGGALVNALGEVVGVNSSIISESGGNVGLGFAIPIDRAKRIADSLLREGEVRRVWVGLEVRAAEPNRFGRSHSVEVASVVSGSAAERAGVRPGMIIDLVNGRPVSTPLDWEARLLDTRVGEALEIVAHEGDNARQTLRIPTQDLPSLTAERVRALTDFEFITLTPAIRAERNLVNERGALIADLSEAARQIGLREGDLIVQVNRTPVASAQEAASLLQRLAGAGPVRVIFERGGRYASVSFYIGG